MIELKQYFGKVKIVPKLEKWELNEVRELRRMRKRDPAHVNVVSTDGHTRPGVVWREGTTMAQRAGVMTRIVEQRGGSS